MDALTNMVVFGVPAITLGIWFAAGLAAGVLLMGRRPVGLLGDLVIGVLGGFLGGWATERLGVRFADYISGIDPNLANYIGEFLTALAGAIIVLIVLRLVIRRR